MYPTRSAAWSFTRRRSSAEKKQRAFSVEYARKDLAYALELARDTSVDAAGARRVDALFAAAIDRGWGEAYHPVISRVVDDERSATVEKGGG